MRTIFETIAAAFSMFSALPVPCVEWNERNTRWLLAVFPLVGIVTGGLCRGWVVLCGWLSLPDMMRGAGLTLLPVLITGGIHLEFRRVLFRSCVAISWRILPSGLPCPDMTGRCSC